MNLRLKKGNWLIGHSPKEDGRRLVYTMLISEVLSMDQYFQDDRFECKKPKPSGTPEEQCGDNIYYKYTDQWKRLPSRFHNHCDNFIQDIDRKVFVAECFYYFGCRRLTIPDDLEGVIQHRQGVHYTTDHLADHFVAWLKAHFKPGILGMPRDLKDRKGETDTMLTECVASNTQQAKNREPRSPSQTPSRGRGCR